MAAPVISLISNSVSRAIGSTACGPSLIPFKVVFSSTTYATASGGIAIDLTGILAVRSVSTSSAPGYYGAAATPAGSTQIALDWTDVIDPGSFGTYSGGDTVIPTKGATFGQYTVRLFNGETETGDGAKTGTLVLWVPVMLGAHSYQAS